MDFLSKYTLVHQGSTYLKISEFLRAYGINRSVISNKKQAHPLFSAKAKNLNGIDGKANTLVMDESVAFLFIVSIKPEKIKNEGLKNDFIIIQLSVFKHIISKIK